MIWETSVGEITVYAIEDGWAWRTPTDLYPTCDPAVWEANPQYLHEGRLRVSYGCFVIRSELGLTLIDSGLGPRPVPEDAGAGKLVEGLAELGIAPGDINTVVHTHLHLDHVGGNLIDGSLTFPNAQVWVHQREVDYWRAERSHPAGDLIRETVEAMDDAGVLQTVDSDQQVSECVTMIETFGHTPGHVGVLIASAGQRAYVVGDITHHPLHVVHTDWTLVYDLDPEAAAATRERVISQLADSGVIMAAGHFPRPGFGKVVTDEGYRVFTPVAATNLA